MSVCSVSVSCGPLEIPERRGLLIFRASWWRKLAGSDFDVAFLFRYSGGDEDFDNGSLAALLPELDGREQEER